MINGGACDEKVRELWMEKCSGVSVKEEKRGSGVRKETSAGRTRSWIESGRGGASEEGRAWDGRRETKRVCSTRRSVAGSRTGSVNKNGRTMSEVKGWRM